jgi:hypothetical protein
MNNSYKNGSVTAMQNSKQPVIVDTKFTLDELSMMRVLSTSSGVVSAAPMAPPTEPHRADS